MAAPPAVGRSRAGAPVAPDPEARPGAVGRTSRPCRRTGPGVPRRVGIVGSRAGAPAARCQAPGRSSGPGGGVAVRRRLLIPCRLSVPMSCWLRGSRQVIASRAVRCPKPSPPSLALPPTICRSNGGACASRADGRGCGTPTRPCGRSVPCARQADARGHPPGHRRVSWRARHASCLRRKEVAIPWGGSQDSLVSGANHSPVHEAGVWPN